MSKRLAITLPLLLAITVLFGGLLFKNDKRKAITITAHVALEKMELDDLIAGADLISLGSVRSVYPSRWNTPDGMLPRGTTAKNIPPGLVILTDVNFQISEILKGDLRQHIVRIRSFGGQVDQDRMLVEDAPFLDVGQTYLLFLSRDSGSTANIGPEHYLVLGSIQGAYRISDSKANSVTDEWVLEDLIAYIKKSLP